MARSVDHSHRSHVLVAQIARNLVDGLIGTNAVDLVARANHVGNRHCSPPPNSRSCRGSFTQALRVPFQFKPNKVSVSWHIACSTAACLTYRDTTTGSARGIRWSDRRFVQQNLSHTPTATPRP